MIDRLSASPNAVRLIVAVLAVLGMVLVVAAPAQAQYVPGQPGIIVDPNTIPDTGAGVNIRGFGCARDTKVDAYITVDGVDIFLGTTTASDTAEGSFDIPATIPPLPAGEYTIWTICGSLKLSTVLTVTATPLATTTTTTSTLPRTGSDAGILVRLGVGLVAAGGLLMLGVRKRRRRAYA